MLYQNSSEISAVLWLFRFRNKSLTPYAGRACLHSGHFHPSQAFREAWLGHALEHFAHLRVLPEQIVDLLDGGTGTARDSLATRAVDGFVMITLPGGHGVDDGFNANDLFLVHFVVYLLHVREWTDARHHTHDAGKRSEFFNLSKLIAKVLKGKPVAGERLFC